MVVMPYKNTEKRKEKSRDAARCRRGKESEVFTDLADCLPLPESVTHQLDKASIIRLSISALKIGTVMADFPFASDEDQFKDEDVCDAVVVAEQQMNDCKVDQLYQRALEGFTFMLSQDGSFVYLSESVAKYLGLTQIELMGQSIYDFTHPCDHEEIRDLLTLKNGNSLKLDSHMPENKVSFLRLKCTLTSKGRNVNLKSACYKVMKCSGRLVAGSADNRKENLCSETGLSLFPYLVGIAEPIPHPSNIEIRLDCSTFLSKHSMDMKFIICDERIEELAGYNSEEMIGQSFFDFTHALDAEAIDKVFKDLFSKGQAMTSSYRFLYRNGGHVWVVTQATIINNSRTGKPQSVVCVHSVLSDVEEKGTILSHVQKQAHLIPLPNHLPLKMEMCTESIFAPKTSDMEQNYFVPPELQGKITYLNNEPADLTYLAPNAGEETIPLPFASSAMDFLVSPSSSVENCVMKQERTTPGPDLIFLGSQSPMSLTPSGASSMNASPNAFADAVVPVDVDSMGQFFQSLTPDDDEAIDFDGRAPYIPMDADQDLEIFGPTSNALFTYSNDVNPGLFGQTENVFRSKESLFDEPEPRATKPLSARDMIDGSTVMASIEQPPDTMFLQLKRPLDMNSLEKGPPRKRPTRLGAKIPSGPCKPAESISIGGKDSVLLNLLLNGEDRNHGYKVTILPGDKNEKQMKEVSRQSAMIPVLTRRDCEVNAPTQFTQLLKGAELLKALDIPAEKAMRKSQL